MSKNVRRKLRRSFISGSVHALSGSTAGGVGKKTQRSSQRAEGVLRILSQNGGMWLKNQVKRLCCKDIDFLEMFKIIGNKSTQKLFGVRKKMAIFAD